MVFPPACAGLFLSVTLHSLGAQVGPNSLDKGTLTATVGLDLCYATLSAWFWVILSAAEPVPPSLASPSSNVCQHGHHLHPWVAQKSSFQNGIHQPSLLLSPLPQKQRTDTIAGVFPVSFWHLCEVTLSEKYLSYEGTSSFPLAPWHSSGWTKKIFASILIKKDRFHVQVGCPRARDSIWEMSCLQHRPKPSTYSTNSVSVSSPMFASACFLTCHNVPWQTPPGPDLTFALVGGSLSCCLEFLCFAD